MRRQIDEKKSCRVCEAMYSSFSIFLSRHVFNKKNHKRIRWDETEGAANSSSFAWLARLERLRRRSASGRLRVSGLSCFQKVRNGIWL